MVEATAKHQWEGIVSRLLPNNGGLDLRTASVHRPNVPAKVFRSRLLDADNDSLLVERPVGGGSVREMLEEDATVFVLLSDEQDRIELACQVLCHEKWQLNRNVELPAVRLSLPHSVHSAQRRRYYRVSVAAQKLGPMYVTPLPPEPKFNSKGQPILSSINPNLPDPMPFEIKLINLAAGGMGSEAEEDNVDMLEAYKDYCVRLELPKLDQPIVVNAKLVHLEKQKREKGHVYYMGMQFIFDSTDHEKQIRQQVTHYTASIEREQIRHIKEKQ